MDVHVDIAGDRQVGLRFEEFPDALHAELLALIGGQLGPELETLVEAATPDRTGRLRGEEGLRVFDDPQSIKAQVSVTAEFAKAAALEYGAHRSTNVKAHSMRLDHAWSRRFNAPLSVLVSAYTRTPDIDEVDFLRGPLAAMAPEAIARMEDVVAKLAQAANQ